MKYGLDFGTSNSVIAFNDGKNVEILPVEPTNGTKEIMPSLWYFDYDDKNWSFGKNAYEVYKETFGEGRLIQSLKKYLSDPSLNNTYVLNKVVEFDELVALYLKYLKSKADTLTGENVKSVTIGKPVNFINTGENDLALKRIYNGAQKAGFTDISFEYEPLAATYSLKQRISEEAVIFTLDMGGGTTDISIVKLSVNSNCDEVLTTQGIDIGGVDFDGRIIRRRLLKYFGDGLLYDPFKSLNLEFPRPLLFPLADRYKIFTLANNKKYLDDVKRASYGLIDPDSTIDALDYLIHRQVGLDLFDEVESAKKTLSQTKSATISYHKGPINIEETITRDQFEDYISDYVMKIENLIHKSLTVAQTTPEEINKIVLVGGSSKIPIIKRTLNEIIPCAEILDIDQMTSIAHGLGTIE